MQSPEESLPSVWLTSPLKRTVYRVLHKLLFNYNINSNVHMALALIEGVQLLQFSTTENNNFSKYAVLEDYFTYVIKCSCLGVVYQNGELSYLVLISLETNVGLLLPCVTLMILARLVYIVWHSKVMNSADNLLLNVLNAMFLLFRTIYVVPFLQLVAISFNPTLRQAYNITVSSTLTIPIIAITSASCLLYLMLLIICTMGLREPDPFSKYSFAGPLNKNEIILTMLKVVLVVYWAIDVSADNLKGYLVAMEVVWVVWLIRRIKCRSFYNDSLEKTSRVLTVFTFWYHTALVLQYWVAGNLRPSLIPILLTTFIVTCTVEFVIEYEQDRIYLDPVITMRSDGDVQNYIYSLITDIEKLEVAQHRTRLEGFLGLHYETCKTSIVNCSCRLLACDRSRSGLSQQQEKSLWYKFILSLLKQTLNKFESSIRIYILRSFILKQRQSNKFSALYNLARCLEKQQTSLLYEFIAHHQKECTQQEMKEDDERYNEKKSVNINRFFQFNNVVVLFEKKVEDCVTNHFDFWRELIEASPEISKLQQLGKTIINEKEETKEMFERVCQLNPNNYQTLFLYGYFLLQVCNEESAHHKVIEKAEIIKRNLTGSKIVTDELKLKYGENAKTGIVVITGNENELGQILNVNNQLKGMLGWTRDQLIGQNLSMIMPKVFGETHNDVLKRFFATSVERFNFKERGAPAFTKDGHMLPCIAMTKALPNLDLGIQIAGFLSVMREVEEDQFDKAYYYILYRTDNGIIQGVSKGCSDQFGIEGILAYGHPKNSSYQLDMKSIFGQAFSDPENIKNMRTKSGLSCRIDTTRLLMQFAIGLESSQANTNEAGNNQDEVVSERSTGNRYKTADVTVKIKLEMVYNGVPLILICFSTDNFYENQKHAESISNMLIPNMPSKRSFHASRVSNMHGTALNRSAYNSNVQPTDTNVNGNDDMKELKDFKNFISAKSEPVSIKIIHYSVVCLLLLLLLLALLTLQTSLTRKAFILEGFEELALSYNKIIKIADMTYDVRKLNLLVSWLNGPSQASELTYTYNNLTYLGEQLRISEFKLLKLKQNMQRAGGNSFLTFVKSQPYPVEDNSTGNTVGLEISTFNFLTNILALTSNATSAPQDFLSFSPYRPPDSDSYFYKLFRSLIYDGLFDLIVSEIKSGSKIFDFYHCHYNECSYEFPVILASSLLIICVSIAIIIPYVFSVNKINNRVLSIFGLIPILEIHFLMARCVDYLSKHITEAHINRFPAPKPLPEPLLSPQTERSGAATPEPIFRKGRATPTKKAMPNDRSVILMNGQHSGQTRTVIQYGAALLLLASYFVVDYVLIKDMLTTSQRALMNLKIINSRSIGLAQLKTLQLQSIIDPTLSANNTFASSVIGMASSLIDNLYVSERDMQNIDVSKFSSNYAERVAKYNLENICKYLPNYYQYQNNGTVANNFFSPEECLETHSGILQKGIKTTMISLLEELRIDLTVMSQRTQQQKITKLLAFMSDIQRIQKYVLAPMADLQQTLYTNLYQTLEKETPIELGKMSGFVVLGILFYLLIWNPYLKDLNMKIWRTKGMLNMIPMKIITNNQQLRSQFTSNKLEKAVR